MASADLELKEVDGISCGIGPGSYTALRVGLSIAKAISFTLKKPVMSLNAFDLLFSCEKRSTNTLALVPARKSEVFYSLFDKFGQILSGPACIDLFSSEFKQLKDAYQPTVISSQPIVEYKDPLIKYNIDAKAYPSLALSKFLSKKFDDIYQLSPLYMKPPHITRSKKLGN